MHAPFAYGPGGRFLTSTEGNEVFVCAAGDEAPLLVHAMAAPVRGVRHVGEAILALDAAGHLTALTSAGATSWSLELGVEPTALAAHPGGAWAVVHGAGVVVGKGGAIERRADLPGAIGAAFDDAGGLALLSPDELVLPGGGRVELPHVANSLAWSARGWWLVATKAGVYRINAGATPDLYLRWSGEHPATRLAASADGKLCAFGVGAQAVAVFGVERDVNCGAIVYLERTAGELEWGPGSYLGIGIGLGDGNKIDVRTGATSRTDPPADRPRNRWALKVGLDLAAISGVLGSAGHRSAGTAAAPSSSGGNARLAIVALVVLGLAALLVWLAAR